ncbi:MAG: NUDIX hydrolase [Candidatus Aenigmatarchaeota archaeon]
MRRKIPMVAVDIIIKIGRKIVIVKRKNFPIGWALPGGFVNYGESVEKAAVREAKEETGLKLKNLKLFGVYSNPKRDPRFHTISITFVANGFGNLKAGSDVSEIKLIEPRSIEKNKKINLVFDHKKIIKDFVRMKI